MPESTLGFQAARKRWRREARLTHLQYARPCERCYADSAQPAQDWYRSLSRWHAGPGGRSQCHYNQLQGQSRLAYWSITPAERRNQHQTKRKQKRSQCAGEMGAGLSPPSPSGPLSQGLLANSCAKLNRLSLAAPSGIHTSVQGRSPGTVTRRAQPCAEPVTLV